MKYLLFRVGREMNENYSEHVLAGAENGKSFYEVEKALLEDVEIDLRKGSGFSGYEIMAETVGVIPDSRYLREMWGVAMPKHEEENILVSYGVLEANE